MNNSYFYSLFQISTKLRSLNYFELHNPVL